MAEVSCGVLPNAETRLGTSVAIAFALPSVAPVEENAPVTIYSNTEACHARQTARLVIVSMAATSAIARGKKGARGKKP